jgi:hypothetical protein
LPRPLHHLPARTGCVSPAEASIRRPDTPSTTTRRYIEAIAGLSEEDRRKIYEGNARKVYARLGARIDQAAGLSAPS